MGKMPLYTMLQKARSAGGWTMETQLEGDAAGSQLLLLEGRPVWQRSSTLDRLTIYSFTFIV